MLWNRRGFASLAVAAMLLAGHAVAQPTRPAPPAGTADREVTVLNKSKRAVNELYVSPSNADQWGEDRLGDDTIEPGKSYRARLGRLRDCEFDVQVVYDDASHEESRKVNLCRNRQVSFDGSNAIAAPKPVGAEHKVTLLNASPRPIQQIFISPADSTQWGDDRLGDTSVSVGERTTITYRGECEADLRVIFDNKGAEERRSVDLCETPVISIEPGWTTADTLPTPGTGATPAPSVTPAPSTTPTPPAPPAAAPRRTEAPAPSGPTVTVVNRSGQPATELYVFPDQGPRGADRLGLDTLADGGQLKLTLDAGAGCRVSVHAVFSGKAPDRDLAGLDVCASPEIVLSAP